MSRLDLSLYDLDYVDLMERNNTERVKARINQRQRVKTTPPSLIGARVTRARPHSLPSGPALSWAGVALALLLLAAGALVLGFAVIGYVLLGMVQRLRGRG